MKLLNLATPALKVWLLFVLTLAFKAAPEAHGQSISPRLVGINLWQDPSAEVWEQTAAARFQTIRIGGHRYDRKMPGNVQMLAWVEQIKAVGAEPVIQVSQYRSAEDAAGLVRFLNIDHGKGVKYWNIGNEPWLQAGRPPWPTVTANIEIYFKSIAAAMKQVDPSIQIFGPDISYFEPEAFKLLIGGANDISSRVPGRDYYYLDGFTYHDYPQRDGAPAFEGAAKIVDTIRHVRQAVDHANALHARTGKDALKWGLGEFNAREGALVNTWGNGQMFAQVLGACMKYGATYAASWSMIESKGDGSRTDFGMIGGSGAPRATYHHMAVIAEYFSGTYAEGKSSDSDVIVFGAVKGERVSVMILNRGSRSFDYSLGLNDHLPDGSPLSLSVKAGSERVHRSRIDGLSTTVLVFEGKALTRWEYTAEDFERHRFPTLSRTTGCHKEVSRIEPLEPVTLKLGGEPQSLALNLTEGSAASVNVQAVSGRPQAVSVGKTTSPTRGRAGELVIAPVSKGSTFVDVHVLDRGTAECGPSDWRTRFTVTVTDSRKPPGRPPTEEPKRLPTKIEAEDYTQMQGLATEETSDEQGGLYVGWVEAGDYLEYRVQVPRPGNYQVRFRVASSEDTGAFEIRESSGKLLGTVSVPDTGGWQAWVTRTTSIYLEQGTYPLRLVFVGGAMNLNWLEVVDSPVPAPTPGSPSSQRPLPP